MSQTAARGAAQGRPLPPRSLSPRPCRRPRQRTASIHASPRGGAPAATGPLVAPVVQTELLSTGGSANTGASSSIGNSDGNTRILQSLQQEVADLRAELSTAAERQEQALALLTQQHEAQQEAIRLIQQQQHTIRLLEQGRASSKRPPGEPAVPPAAAAAAVEAPAAGARLVLPHAGDSLAAFMNPSIVDRRSLGSYDARFHSTSWAATPTDHRLLPRRIVLVRHAQSKGNVDPFLYEHTPDPSVPLTATGWQQAVEAGEKLKAAVEADGCPARLFFYTSPYLRCKQTTEGMVQAFAPEQLLGVQEEVQLREQDFGNFQDAQGKRREKLERLRFGRFFYRFPHGESGADVYDRMTLFEDHLVRDINAGRFGQGCTLVLVTHGLAARIFLQRWFHWTVDDFLAVYNPPNAEPITLERLPSDLESRGGGPASWVHTKALYRLTDESREHLVGCSADMCRTSWLLQGRGLDSGRKFSSH